MGRERMQIASIEVVVDQDLMSSLEESRLTRSEIREKILDQGHKIAREQLQSPLRRIDLRFVGKRRVIDVYGPQPECVRGNTFSAW
jgi:hypothetical protein